MRPSAIRAFDLESGAPLAEPDLPSCVIERAALRPHARRALLTMATPARARDPFELDLEAGGPKVEYLEDERSGHGPADRATALTWYVTIAELRAAPLPLLLSCSHLFRSACDIDMRSTGTFEFR